MALSDDDLLTIFDGLWAGEDLRLNTWDPDDLSEILQREKQAKVALQREMDERGLESPLTEHLIPNVLATVRPPSAPSAPRQTSRP